jgi:2-keto-4-pentenoate hydratase
MLFADMDVMTGGEVPWAAVMHPKVEAEIAFVVGTDLTDPSVTTAEVLSAIEYAVPSLEIVGSRVADWNIRITDTIADNASASHFVLGHAVRTLDQVDLLDCGMEMAVNGETVSKGLGRACLGSPVNATVWLAQKMAEMGNPLSAGDVVLAGALGPMAPVKPGDQVVATIEGFGEVSVGFGEE